VRAFRELGIPYAVLHTGQHYDYAMSDLHFTSLGLEDPQFHLGIGSDSHARQTARMLGGIEEVLLRECPSFVVVYGDTNSTLAGALAAVKLGIPVGHVEAGVRSFDRRMPEEINRVVADHVSDHHFCPTANALSLLGREGIEGILTGDVMYDALLQTRREEMTHPYALPFVLVTIHRAENTDDVNRLTQIVGALNVISRTTKIVLPLHPRTKGLLEKNGIQLEFSTIEPVGYFDMLSLLEHCELVMTDSGGLQKEAYFFSKYCLTLRDQTEWVELVDAGVNSLVGADSSKILLEFETAKQKPVTHSAQLYGDGAAAQKIAQKLSSF